MKENANKQLLLNNLLDRPANQLLSDFGAGKASPGSGSATALLSLLAAKMIITVCKISLRKRECNEYHNQFEYITNQVETKYFSKLQELFEKDAKDFAEIVKLRKARNAATDKNEKSNLSRQALEKLENATDYIFEVAEISFQLVEYGIAMYKHGWEHIRGDSGVAISSALSAIMSAIFIINLNIKTLQRRNYANDAMKRCKDIQNRFEEIQIEAFSCIASISKEALESLELSFGDMENS